MKCFISMLTAAFLLVISAAAYSQSQSQAQSQSQPQSQSQAQKQPEAQKQPLSLAELAKREKERRAKVTAALKSLTNEDTGKYRDAAIATVAKPAPPEAEKKTGEEGEAQPNVEKVQKPEGAPVSDEPVDLQGRTESFWRQTFTDARQKVKSLEDQGNVLILKLNDLQNQFYREANGFKQQEIQREIQKTIYEQDKNKEDLKKAKDELSDLEKEARKSGALPGWFSGKKP